MPKSLEIQATITLPTGSKIPLGSPLKFALSGLEEYAVDALLAGNGGTLDVRVDATITEVSE